METGHGGNVYTMETGECCTSGFLSPEDWLLNSYQLTTVQYNQVFVHLGQSWMRMEMGEGTALMGSVDSHGAGRGERPLTVLCFCYVPGSVLTYPGIGIPEVSRQKCVQIRDTDSPRIPVQSWS